jgi:hypothetical protein
VDVQAGLDSYWLQMHYVGFVIADISFSILGDFVMIEPIGEGDKVKAEIVNILYKDQIKYIKDEGKW